MKPARLAALLVLAGSLPAAQTGPTVRDSLDRLETLYLADLFHPGLFPDFDLERTGEEVFTRFYGRPGIFRAFSAILGCRERGHD